MQEPSTDKDEENVKKFNEAVGATIPEKPATPAAPAAGAPAAAAPAGAPAGGAAAAQDIDPALRAVLAQWLGGREVMGSECTFSRLKWWGDAENMPVLLFISLAPLVWISFLEIDHSSLGQWFPATECLWWSRLMSIHYKITVFSFTLEKETRGNL